MSKLLSGVRHAGIVVAAAVFLFPFFWMLSTALRLDREVFSVPPRLLPGTIHWFNFVEAWRYLPFGTFFFKGQSMGTGQANVKQYNRQLRNLIHRDKLSPGIIVSHELSLEQAAEGYENFDERLDGWTKVLLHP